MVEIYYRIMRQMFRLEKKRKFKKERTSEIRSVIVIEILSDMVIDKKTLERICFIIEPPFMQRNKILSSVFLITISDSIC